MEKKPPKTNKQKEPKNISATVFINDFIQERDTAKHRITELRALSMEPKTNTVTT